MSLLRRDFFFSCGGFVGLVFNGHCVLPSLFKALLFAKPVDLRRLAATEPPGAVPTAAEWQALDEAEAAAGLDVCGLEAYAKKDLLRGLLGAAAVDVELANKTDAQRAAEGAWYGKMDWWFNLKAAGFPTPSA